MIWRQTNSHVRLLRAAGVEPGRLTFAFRPLWQLSATERAQVALGKAQATAIYAGLNLWPAATTAALVRSQLIEDGTYPGAEAAFALEAAAPVADYAPSQPRDPDGRWTGGGSGIPDPGVPAARLPIGPTPNTTARVQIVGGPYTGETPDEEDQRHEHQSLRSTREKRDLSTGVKLRPDGSLEPSKLLPTPAEPGQTGAEMRPFVGPGPFARRPIPLDSRGEVGRAKQREIDAEGALYGCHTCGAPQPGTKTGSWIGDHQDRQL